MSPRRTSAAGSFRPVHATPSASRKPDDAAGPDPRAAAAGLEHDAVVDARLRRSPSRHDGDVAGFGLLARRRPSRSRPRHPWRLSSCLSPWLDRAVGDALHGDVDAGPDLEASLVDPLLAVFRLERPANLLDEVRGDVGGVAP